MYRWFFTGISVSISWTKSLEFPQLNCWSSNPCHWHYKYELYKFLRCHEQKLSMNTYRNSISVQESSFGIMPDIRVFRRILLKIHNYVGFDIFENSQNTIRHENHEFWFESDYKFFKDDMFAKKSMLSVAFKSSPICLHEQN